MGRGSGNGQRGGILRKLSVGLLSFNSFLCVCRMWTLLSQCLYQINKWDDFPSTKSQSENVDIRNSSYILFMFAWNVHAITSLGSALLLWDITQLPNHATQFHPCLDSHIFGNTQRPPSPNRENPLQQKLQNGFENDWIIGKANSNITNKHTTAVNNL